MDKAEGKMKEAYSAIIGDEAKKAEQREKTRRAEAEAREAEKERDRQRRKDNGGLGGLTGTLTGR